MCFVIVFDTHTVLFSQYSPRISEAWVTQEPQKADWWREADIGAQNNKIQFSLEISSCCF